MSLTRPSTTHGWENKQRKNSPSTMLLISFVDVPPGQVKALVTLEPVAAEIGILLESRQSASLVYLSAFSSQPNIDQSLAPSATTNFNVVNSILAYRSRAAMRARLCHGPVPPSLASSRFLQRPFFPLCQLTQSRGKDPQLKKIGEKTLNY